MTDSDRQSAPPLALTVGAVPGVTVTKWSRIWAERFPTVGLEVVLVEQPDQRAALDEGRVDMCFVRQPFEQKGAHLIPLYEEVPVVVVPKDHVVSVLESVTLADLEGEDRVEAGATARDHALAFELVAAGAGVLLVPHSIARAHTRKDLCAVPIDGVDPTRVGLAWLVEPAGELVEEFIGVVRGRTVNSTRSPSGSRAAAAPSVGSPASPPRSGRRTPAQPRGRRGRARRR